MNADATTAVLVPTLLMCLCIAAGMGKRALGRQLRRRNLLPEYAPDTLDDFSPWVLNSQLPEKKKRRPDQLSRSVRCADELEAAAGGSCGVEMQQAARMPDIHAAEGEEHRGAPTESEAA